MTETELLFARERGRFPAAEETAYFQSAGTGLVPDYVHSAFKNYQDQRFYHGGNSCWEGLDTKDMMELSKARLGEMLGCSGKNIAFADNSSRMLNIFINGIGLKAGDNVILSEDSFINSKYAWQMKEPDGIELRYASSVNGVVAPESFFELADENTRVIFTVFVESGTGYKHDLKRIGEFCRGRGILFCVDGVQGMGAQRLDIRQFRPDYLVGTDYKWMMGFSGTGFAYISDELIGSLKNCGAGWLSDKDRFDTSKKHIELRQDAGRFDMGLPNTAGIYALGLVARNYLRLGAENIENYLTFLRRYMENGVALLPNAECKYSFGEENKSQISFLLVRNVRPDFPGFLERKRISVNTYMEGDACSLRVGMHYYNNTRDIDRLLEALEEYGKTEVRQP